MKRPFSASIVRDGDWYVAQCLEVDVASQGATEDEAVENLCEVRELHFAPPRAEAMPSVRHIDVDIDPA